MRLSPLRTAVAAVALLSVGGITGCGTSAEEERLIELGRVAEETICERLTGGEVLVWLDPAVTAEQVETIRAELDVLGAAHSYVDEAETHTEFEEMFAESPELIETVDASQLPTRFTLSSEFDEALDARLIALPGVDSVDRPAAAIDDRWVTPCEALA